MYRDPNEDVVPAVAILLAGMLVPALAVAAARDLLAMYLPGARFVVAAAVAFGVGSWLAVEAMDLDRTTFVLVSVVFPWLVLVGAGFVVLLLNEGEQVPRGAVADVFRYLADAGLVLYGGSFATAGAGAGLLSRRFRESERLPEARAVLAATVAVVVLAAAAVGAANFAAASSATLSTVEPGVQHHRDPTLNATVEGPAAEMRVTAVAPDGTSVTRRLSRGDMRGGTGRVAVPVEVDDTPPPGTLPVRAGTYRVRLTTLAGVTVDTATFEARAGPAVAVTDTVATTGNLSWDRPPGAGGHGTDGTTVGVVVENRGAFPTAASVSLDVPDEDVRSGVLFLDPGERSRVAFRLPDDTAERVRTEQGGVVTVRVTLDGGETVSTVGVELPAG